MKHKLNSETENRNSQFPQVTTKQQKNVHVHTFFKSILLYGLFTA